MRRDQLGPLPKSLAPSGPEGKAIATQAKTTVETTVDQRAAVEAAEVILEAAKKLPKNFLFVKTNIDDTRKILDKLPEDHPERNALEEEVGTIEYGVYEEISYTSAGQTAKELQAIRRHIEFLLGRVVAQAKMAEARIERARAATRGSVTRAHALTTSLRPQDPLRSPMVAASQALVETLTVVQDLTFGQLAVVCAEAGSLTEDAEAVRKSPHRREALCTKYEVTDTPVSSSRRPSDARKAAKAERDRSVRADMKGSGTGKKPR